MDLPQSTDIDSTSDNWNKTSIPEPEIPSNGPSYNPVSSTTPTNNSETSNPVVDSIVNQGKAELKKGHQQGEDIITKSKKCLKQHWDQTCTSLCETHKKVVEMVPKEATELIYWQNPIKSGIVFGVSLSVIITFMFLSALAAVSFWLLAVLVVIGLYKLYNYVMTTFVGRPQEDIFESIFPPDVNISERQAQALANTIRVNGTNALKTARSLFLWTNLKNSIIFGHLLFVGLYIGLKMNSLTFALVGLIFLFTVPKIYQVYQVPIDRAAKQVLDKINQLLAKVTSKLPHKAKKA